MAFKRGEKVSWHYRGAIGHGTIDGIYKRGTTDATTEYNIRETDHHPGEKAVIHHFGRALHRGSIRPKGRKMTRKVASRSTGRR